MPCVQTQHFSQHTVTTLYRSGLIQAINTFEKYGDQVGAREIRRGHRAREQRLDQCGKYRVGHIVRKSAVVFRLGRVELVLVVDADDQLIDQRHAEP